MIWIVATITLYLLISAAALVVIASEDKSRGNDAYYDVRNIGTALIWWVVLVMAGCAWFFKKTIKPKADADH